MLIQPAATVTATKIMKIVAGGNAVLCFFPVQILSLFYTDRTDLQHLMTAEKKKKEFELGFSISTVSLTRTKQCSKVAHITCRKMIYQG